MFGRTGKIRRRAATRLAITAVYLEAGVIVIARFEDAPVQDYSRLVDVNLKGVIYLSYAALRRFRVQGHGTLINIGSVHSEVPLAYQAVYSATKAGVLSLGRTLGEESA